MRREDVLRLLTQHREELATFGIRRLALFGSVARDAANSSSDIDMLVEFEGSPSFDRYVELNFFLEDLLHRPVDLVTLPFLRESLRNSIEQDALDVPGLSPLASAAIRNGSPHMNVHVETYHPARPNRLSSSSRVTGLTCLARRAFTSS